MITIFIYIERWNWISTLTCFIRTSLDSNIVIFELCLRHVWIGSVVMTSMEEKTFQSKINAPFAFKLAFEGCHKQYQHMAPHESDNMSTRCLHSWCIGTSTLVNRRIVMLPRGFHSFSISHIIFIGILSNNMTQHYSSHFIWW